MKTARSRAVHRAMRRWLPDSLGIAWVLVAAGSALAPALVHGASLHNPGGGADQLDYFIPSTTLAWTQVHHGHLPLWNPYSALGLPLAFNWQSAAFGVPALVSYLVPLHFAYLTQILVTLALAGTGVYVLGRVIGLGVLGSAMAATLYVLSGPFMGWLGWPVAGVLSWVGWLFAAAIVIVRGRHRVRSITVFALVLAAAVYAGHPEALVLLGASFAVFLGVLLVQRAAWLGGSGPILRPVLDMAVAAVAGVALAAPLVLPGIEVVSGSMSNVKGITTYRKALPLRELVYFLQGTAYVGVIAVALIVVAAAVRRRPVTLAFVAVALATGFLAFSSPLVSVVNELPYLGNVHWDWATVPMAFALALPAGIGLDTVVRSSQEQRVRFWFVVGLVGAGAVLVGVFVVGRGHGTAGQAAVQRGRVWWPVAEVVLGLAVVWAVTVIARRGPDGGALRRRLAGRAGRWAGVVLLGAEAAFLAAAAAPLWSSGPTNLTPPDFAVALKRVVASSVVANGTRYCFPISSSIVQNENVVYEVHELAAYDPAIPRAYFQSWEALTGEPAGTQVSPPIYCPAVTTAAQARLYGVNFIIEPDGGPVPKGTVLDTLVRGERLYRVPGSALATLSPLRADGAVPGPTAPGTPVAVTHPDPASWTLSTDATGARVLRLRLTDVPGWHASIDGRPLELTRFAGVMLQAQVPPGRHRIELHYWPDTFTVGLVVAGLTAVGLISTAVVARAHRRRGKRVGAPVPASTAGGPAAAARTVAHRGVDQTAPATVADRSPGGSRPDSATAPQGAHEDLVDPRRGAGTDTRPQPV